MAKKVLITGISGFIGRNIALKFQGIGCDIFGWDIFESRFENAELSFFDMDNYEAVENKLRELTPDIIIHCAGCADVGKSVENPQQDFKGNVAVTHNLLFAIHGLRLVDTRVIFISSAAVYGNPESLPINEESKRNPLSPYALHKAMDEQICLYFHQNYGMDIKIARIFSAYGRGLKKQIFWDMYRKAIATGKLSMMGTGNESRDYVHITDVTEAVVRIAFHAKQAELVYNIAGGEEVTIKSATNIFADYMKIRKESISFCGKTREGDPANWHADISKLEALGYQRSVSLEEGIKDYIAWLKGEEGL